MCSQKLIQNCLNLDRVPHWVHAINSKVSKLINILGKSITKEGNLEHVLLDLGEVKELEFISIVPTLLSTNNFFLVQDYNVGCMQESPLT